MKPDTLSLILFVLLTYFALSPRVQAVNPPPDGGYPGNNTAEGSRALFSLSSGLYNTATGADSMYYNTTGNNNTATGFRALFRNTTGSWNTATGYGALYNMVVGCCSTATGFQALYHDIAGGNTATGHQALFINTTGDGNTAVGIQALRSNVIGSWNVAVGKEALFRNTHGLGNTAVGADALFSNTTGVYNTANGSEALHGNITGSNNIAVGQGALYFHTAGDYNVAVGTAALGANRTGNQNIGIGFQAGQDLISGNDNIYIGSVAGNSESNTIRIGGGQTRTVISGIRGATVAGGILVYVGSDGQLGTQPSSARFKQDIQSMDDSSSVLLSLRPVMFRYKKEIDPVGMAQFGLVAEEVEKLNSDLVVCDKDGKPYAVRYDQVNAMLLNEFLKEHQTVQELKSAAVKQEAMIASQQKQIEALIAGLQKVSAQLAAASPSSGGLEASKFATGRIRGGGPAARVVNNP
jgi:trimeric autotransporter adhesin